MKGETMNRREFLCQGALTIASLFVPRETLERKAIRQMGERPQESNELVAELEEEITQRALEDDFW